MFIQWMEPNRYNYFKRTRPDSKNSYILIYQIKLPKNSLKYSRHQKKKDCCSCNDIFKFSCYTYIFLLELQCMLIQLLKKPYFKFILQYEKKIRRLEFQNNLVQGQIKHTSKNNLFQSLWIILNIYLIPYRRSKKKNLGTNFE